MIMAWDRPCRYACDSCDQRGEPRGGSRPRLVRRGPGKL